MKKIIFLLFLSTGMTAQTVKYTYDAAGNRVQRKLDVSDPSTQRTIETNQDEKATQKASELGLSVFPNPAQDKVNVVIGNLKEGQQVSIFLIDEQGKSLLSQKASIEQSTLDMSLYKPGIYFIKVVVDKETLFYKVLKL